MDIEILADQKIEERARRNHKERQDVELDGSFRDHFGEEISEKQRFNKPGKLQKETVRKEQTGSGDLQSSHKKAEVVRFNQQKIQKIKFQKKKRRKVVRMNASKLRLKNDNDRNQQESHKELDQDLEEFILN